MTVIKRDGGDYGTSLLGHSIPGERERLTLLAREKDPATFELLSSLAPKPHWRCLDLGAGLGTVGRWLAARCAEVVCTDTDTTFVDEIGVPNLHVRVHDIVTDDFPRGMFDLVHARCLFEHLAERDTLLEKVIGWLAPGGWLVITDNAVFPAHASARPVIGRLASAVEHFLSATIGSDFGWAPRLPVLLAEAGLVDVDLSIRTEILRGGPGEGSTRVKTVRLLPELVDRGLLGAEDADAVLRLFADPSFVDLSVASVSAWGRRPLT